MRGGGLGLPDRTQHRDFGAVAAAWGMLEDLGAAGIIDEVTGAPHWRAPAPPPGPTWRWRPWAAGRTLLQAGVRRLVVRHCGRAVHQDRRPDVLDHRRFWDAMHAVTLEQMEEISRRIALAIVESSGADCSSVALDMTNFATFIDTGNEEGADRAAGEGEAETLRPAAGRASAWSSLATAGSRSPGTPTPVISPTSPVPRHDRRPSQARTPRSSAASGQAHAEMTVVFDAGQELGRELRSTSPRTRLRYVGSVPASDCGELTALPASARTDRR